MKRVEIDHPSPATERAQRWAEIEEVLVGLRELGWRVERFTQIDEDGEPLRAWLRLRVDPDSSLGGVL